MDMKLMTGDHSFNFVQPYFTYTQFDWRFQLYPDPICRDRGCQWD